MTISLQTAAHLLLEHDHIVILSHRKPDGDTYGSAFGLLYALEALGKTARVECADGYLSRFDFIFGDYAPKAFAPKFVVAVDVADRSLLGSLAEVYPQIDLCIDHHPSNTLFATHTLLESAAPATAQLMYRLIAALDVRPDKAIANALFTGLSTDTGCFRFSSVTSTTHRIAADLIDCGAQHYVINKRMFDTKTPGRLQVERLMLEGLEYFLDGKVALIYLPEDIIPRFQVTEDDLDGLASFPRRIEGVVAGVTLRGNGDGSYRVSLRTEAPLDAARICATFGGGGHRAAAGCTLTGELSQVKAQLLDAVAAEFQLAGDESL